MVIDSLQQDFKKFLKKSGSIIIEPTPFTISPKRWISQPCSIRRAIRKQLMRSTKSLSREFTNLINDSKLIGQYQRPAIIIPGIRQNFIYLAVNINNVPARFTASWDTKYQVFILSLDTFII